MRRDNLEAAVAFRNRAEKTLQRLKQSPESGSVLPECPDLPFREVIEPPCRFLYRIKEKALWIVAVRHEAPLPGTPPEDEIA